MKKVVMEKWVAALRSGEYKQCTGELKKNGGFCCLGVLCDISGVGKWIGSVYQDNKPDPDFNSESNTNLIPAVMEWAGMKDDGGMFRGAIRIKDAYEYNSLIDLNDDAGYDFNKIADVIEKKWRSL